MTYREIREAATETHKHCTKCGEFQPLEEFYGNAKGFKGRQPACRTCTRPGQAAWQRANPRSAEERARIRRARAVQVYGPKALDIVLRIEAGEGCEVCGGRTSKMPVDHDHETGEPRGLLCSNCNTALGLVGEDVDRLMALAMYLLQHENVLTTG
jgi:hypothetical protein